MVFCCKVSCKKLTKSDVRANIIRLRMQGSKMFAKQCFKNYPCMANLLNGGILVKAIIQTGGKQYTVSEKDVITIEKIATDEGKKYDFTEVLAIIDGDKLTVGKPFVTGAKVTGKVLAHGKERKILVFKYKPKKGYHKQMGHRQQFTKVQIEKIALKAEKGTE